MATTRPFSYNTGSTIDGTIQIGNIAIGVSDQDYSLDPGGVKWWMGPDEDLGYVIANDVPTGDHPTPVEVDSYINFWRSEELTDQSFLDLLNVLPITEGLEPFTNGNDAKTWLNNNGYWTSYGEDLQTPTATPIPSLTPTATPTSTPTSTPIPTATSTPVPTEVSTNTPTPEPTNTITSTPTGDLGGNLLQENGESLLQENGDNILLESTSITPTATPTPTSTPAFYQYGGYFDSEYAIQYDACNQPLVDGVTLYGLTPTFSVGDTLYKLSNFSDPFINGAPGYYIKVTNTYNDEYILTTDTNGVITELILCSTLLTSTPTPTPDATSVPTDTPTPIPATSTPTPAPTDTPTPTVVPSTATPTPTETSTPTPTETPIPATSTPTPTSTTVASCSGIRYNLTDDFSGPPTSGNTLWIYNGSPAASNEVNRLAIANPSFISRYDNNGTDRLSYFGNFTGSTFTMTVCQDGNSAIYSGITGTISYNGTDLFELDATKLSLVQSSPVTAFTFNQSVYYNFTDPSQSTPTPTPTVASTNIPTDTPTPTPEATNVPTDTPTPTPEPATATPTPTSTGGGIGAWYFYSDEGSLNAPPPVSDGNAVFLINGTPKVETYNPNKSNGVNEIYFNLSDSNGTDYTSQFTTLTQSGGTITITQGTNTVTYTGTTSGTFFIDTMNGFFIMQTEPATQTVTSANPFVFGDPISLTFG